jgi:hypothetical protein
MTKIKAPTHTHTHASSQKPVKLNEENKIGNILLLLLL